jgi:spore coat polysaccharide biosynthesis predicted glycosyltransferase SpsG
MEEPKAVLIGPPMSRARAVSLALKAAEQLQLDNQIRIAVAAGDAVAAGKAADKYRFRYGCTYNQICARFQELTGISSNDFEELMYQADSAEGEERFQ